MENSKKRLIFFMPSFEGGGVEKNLVIVSNYLSKKIPNVSLITFDSKFNYLFNKRIKIINYSKNSNKIYSKYFKYYKCLLILFKEYLRNKSLIVISFQANIYAIILASILKFNIISRSNSSPTGWKNNFIKLSIFKFFFKLANEIIVNSRDFKNEFKKNFNINATVIYNPLNYSEILKKSKEKLKFKFFDNYKGLKIINIARFTDQKDHTTLLRAIKLVSKKARIRLLIMGYGKNKSQIKKFIKDNNLKKIIKIVNFQRNPYNYLRKADILILSSRFEGLPNVLIEAQTLKKFIISSNCPTGPREILLDGKLGDLFKIGDYNDLSNKVLNFNKNLKINKEKIKLGHKKLKRFNYIDNCEKYYNLIQKYI